METISSHSTSVLSITGSVRPRVSSPTAQTSLRTPLMKPSPSATFLSVSKTSRSERTPDS